MTILCALLLAVQTPTPSPQQTPDSAHLVIVATTDVHGRVLGWDDVRDVEAPGGLSRAATIVSTLRTQYPGQVLLVDAGDLIEGSPFATYYGKVSPTHPSPSIDALNALNYDAATPGNHEFNFGVDLLKADAADATFQYVSANIMVLSTREERSDVPLFSRGVVVLRNGIRVGITGFTTPGVMVWDRANVTGRVRVEPIAQSAPAALQGLDRQGVDFKLVLIHSGLGGASSYDTTGVGPENDAAALASLTSKPDLVVFGHTHGEVRDSVINGVHFVQPKNWAQSLSVVHVWFRRVGGHWTVDHLRADLIPLANTAELPAYVRRFSAAHDRVRSWGSQNIGTADPGFDGRYGRAEDTPLLDFVNWVQRTRAGADLSATADFDVNAGLSREIHQRDVAGIYPYDNNLVAIRISGRQLKDYLEQSARYYHTYLPGHVVVNADVPGENFDAVDGVDYQIDLSQPLGQRVRGLLFHGKPVTGTDSFTLALSGYRAAGGGGYGMLKGARVVYDKGEDIRDLLVEEIRRVGNLTTGMYFHRNWSILPPAQAAVHAVFGPVGAAVSDADSTMLRVLAIADLHGALQPRTWDWSQGRPVGGVAALKGWMDSLAADCACTSIRLDAGDEMQGTPVSNFAHGGPVIAALDRIGIDAAAIGNHEFDWSVDTLRARMGEAHYAFLSANITDSGGTRRPEWVEPWTIISRGGLKIVVIGLTTTSTPTTTEPRNVTGLAFGDLAATVRRELPAARAAGNFVVVLAHAGAICDSGPCHGEIIDFARALDSGSVDLIVAGHTHQRVNLRVNGIPIVEASSSGRTMAIADFVRAGGHCCDVRTRLVDLYADAVHADTGLARMVNRAQGHVDSLTKRSIAVLRFGLTRQGDEYPLGRLIADAQRNIGRADVSIVNNGGIRSDLPAGTVTYGDLFLTEPFQNRVVRVTVTGAVLMQALEHVVSGEERAQVAGVEIWYDAKKPAGQRIKRVRFFNGRKVDAKASYTLAVSDFLAAGGSGFAMLKGQPTADAGLTDIDALIAYLRVLPQPVDAPGDVRLHAER